MTWYARCTRVRLNGRFVEVVSMWRAPYLSLMLVGVPCYVAPGQYPEMIIANELITARIYRPDPVTRTRLAIPVGNADRWSTRYTFLVH